MENLLNQISKLSYHSILVEQLSNGFENALKLLYPNLTIEEQTLLKKDIDWYLYKGRFVVHNTFAGGIIFLREPETIIKIKIEFNTQQNNALASVEYAFEKRNARNVKYKPNTGKIESITWNMRGVFPNFNKYNKICRTALIVIIGKIVKGLCEEYKRDSWFMKYEREFELELFCDNELLWKYDVEII